MLPAWRVGGPSPPRVRRLIVAVGWREGGDLIESPRPSFTWGSFRSLRKLPGKKCLLLSVKQHLGTTELHSSLESRPLCFSSSRAARSLEHRQTDWMRPCALPQAAFSRRGSRRHQKRFNVKSHVLSIIPRNTLVGFSTCNHTSGIKTEKESRIACHVLLLSALALILTVD